MSRESESVRHDLAHALIEVDNFRAVNERLRAERERLLEFAMWAAAAFRTAHNDDGYHRATRLIDEALENDLRMRGRRWVGPDPTPAPYPEDF